MLLPLVAAAGYASLILLTRKMGRSESAAAMALYIQLTFAIVAIAMGISVGDGRFAGSGHPSVEFILRAWVWPAQDDLMLIFLSGVASGFGGYLISQAYRNSEIGLVAPFEYSALIMATVLGFLIWNDLPDIFAATGIVLILGSGVLVAIRNAPLRASRRA